MQIWPPPIVSLRMTIDSADDLKISNRTINANRISNRTYDSKSNRVAKLCRSLGEMKEKYDVTFGNITGQQYCSLQRGSCVSLYVWHLTAQNCCRLWAGFSHYVKWDCTVGHRLLAVSNQSNVVMLGVLVLLILVIICMFFCPCFCPLNVLIVMMHYSGLPWRDSMPTKLVRKFIILFLICCA